VEKLTAGEHHKGGSPGSFNSFILDKKNKGERELRRLVIARKISFGSQSEDGARTRETLMTVLHTLSKRTSEVMAAFKSILDKVAEQPDCDPAETFSSFNSS